MGLVSFIVLMHLTATLLMTGVIWFVQLVHYPLFRKVGSEDFARYEQAHTRRITPLVAPLMLLELLSAFLLIWHHPASIPAGQIYLGLGLVIFIWLCTTLIQVPQHRLLSRGFDAQVHRNLVNYNWLRTIAWSGRTLLVLGWAAKT